MDRMMMDGVDLSWDGGRRRSSWRFVFLYCGRFAKMKKLLCSVLIVLSVWGHGAVLSVPEHS